MHHDEILRALGRLEGKVDRILDLAADDGDRIASLEKKVWGFPAIGALATLLIGRFTTH